MVQHEHNTKTLDKAHHISQIIHAGVARVLVQINILAVEFKMGWHKYSGLFYKLLINRKLQ